MCFARSYWMVNSGAHLVPAGHVLPEQFGIQPGRLLGHVLAHEVGLCLPRTLSVSIRILVAR